MKLADRHRRGRDLEVQWGPAEWPGEARGVGVSEAPRGALDPHQGYPDRQLPVRRADHLERLAV